MNNQVVAFVFFLITGFSISCNNKKKSENSLPTPNKTEYAKKASISANPKNSMAIKAVAINYHLLALDSILISHLHDSFGNEKLNLILAVNRIDFEHVWRADTLVIPDTFISDLNQYAPFPEKLKLLSDIHKLILFSYYSQSFAAYESGKLVRWGPTSMGKRTTPTPTGLFFTNWKAKQTVSTENNLWILNWYFNLDNSRGVSMHQYDLPGFPASHACMRLYEEDAHWLYNWADQWVLKDNQTISKYGTPVIIFGKYPFGKRKPWLQLPQRNNATYHQMEELNIEIEKFLPDIRVKQEILDTIN